MVLSYLCINLHPCMHACTYIKYHTLHNCLFTTTVTQRATVVNMRNRKQNTSNSFISFIFTMLLYLRINLHTCMHIKYHTLHNWLFTAIVTVFMVLAVRCLDFFALLFVVLLPSG